MVLTCANAVLLDCFVSDWSGVQHFHGIVSIEFFLELRPCIVVSCHRARIFGADVKLRQIVQITSFSTLCYAWMSMVEPVHG